MFEPNSIRTVISNYIPVVIFTEFNHKFGLPRYENLGDSGMDIRANKNVTIFPNCTALVPTGIFVSIPDGFEIQVRPRSGLSLKTSLRIANSPGTIDKNYFGEIFIITHNTHHKESIEIELGNKIAQLVLARVPKIDWQPVYSKEEFLAFNDSTRGESGFGSTGLN